MNERLLRLISQLVDKASIGTLSLGKGRSTRRLFFSGDEIHLVDAGRETRFVPATALLHLQRVSRSILADTLEEIIRSEDCASTILVKKGILSDEHRAAYAELEILEEILWIVGRSGQHFLFEEGNVPEEVLLPTDGRPEGIPLRALLPALARRAEEVRETADVLPRTDEIPVLTARGCEARESAHHWIYAQVAGLIDGRRSVQRILNDCAFYPHRTLQILCAAMRQGWIKKTLLRELDDLDPTTNGPEDAALALPGLELAMETALDPTVARSRYIEFAIRAGRINQAAEELVRAGDAALAEGDSAGALASYTRAHELTPDDQVPRSKLYQLHFSAAESALDRGDTGSSRALLERAIEFSALEFTPFLALVRTHLPDEEEVSREVARILDRFRREGQRKRGAEFLDLAIELQPENPLLLRRRVNMFLDGGDTDGAVRALEQLEQIYGRRGELDLARSMREKTDRMRPAESHGKERTGGRGSSPRRRLVSPLALVIAMVAILFGGYQEFVRRGLQQKRDQFLAIAIAEIPEPGTPGYLQQKKRSHKFVEDFERFRRQHPFSIWSLAAARISQAAEDRVVFLEHLLRRKLTGLLAEAERAEVLGRLDRALELYTRMAERGAGTSWESQAEGRLRELMQYRKRAQELFDLASSTEERGRPQDAFEIYRELLITYPRSEAARRVRLPLRIESTPSGASVHSRGTLLGTTPVLLHVNPYEPLALTLRDDAGHERRLTVENPLGFRVRVSLGSP